jgi:hypothetical protein
VASCQDVNSTISNWYSSAQKGSENTLDAKVLTP